MSYPRGGSTAFLSGSDAGLFHLFFGVDLGGGGAWSKPKRLMEKKSGYFMKMTLFQGGAMAPPSGKSWSRQC